MDTDSGPALAPLRLSLGLSSRAPRLRSTRAPSGKRITERRPAATNAAAVPSLIVPSSTPMLVATTMNETDVAWRSAAGRIRRPPSDSDQVPWGYLRTVGEHLLVGSEAGLSCEAVYLFDRQLNLRAVRSAPSIRLGWPTWGEADVAVVFMTTGEYA